MNLKSTAQDLLQNKLYKSAYARSRFTLYGQVLKEVRMSFRQFFTWHYPFRSFFRTLGIICSSLVRLFLGRSLKYSFSYTGEDRILESIYKPLITDNGYYVDVGCNHPTLFSNTYLFYRRGWRGVCVDANEKLTQLYKLYRPHDQVVCALVSDKTQQRNFFVVENDVLSSTELQFIDTYKQQGLSVQTTRKTSRTLTSILDELQSPFEIDILSIDVEEHDYAVLTSLDLKKYKPKLIVIEDETFDLLNPVNNPIYTFLVANGYSFAGFVLKNLYFQVI